MAETLISPGIQITETDLSYVVPRPIVAGAALVGPTAKGPVMVPTKVTSYAQFLRTFGSTFEITVPSSSEGDVEIPERIEKQEFITSIAAKSYFEQGGDSILVTRVANRSDFGPAVSTKIVNGEKVEVETTETYWAVEREREVEEGTTGAVSRTRNVTYWVIVNPETQEETEVPEGTEGAVEKTRTETYWVVVEEVEVEEGTEGAQEKTRTVTNEESAGKESFKLYTLSEGEYLNNAASEEYKPYESGSECDEREDYSLISGSSENFRFEIVNVDEDRGTFGINIRRGDDTGKQKIILESWQNLSLDPNSPNYIAARIGDQAFKYEVDDDQTAHIDVSGNYVNKSAFVRVVVLQTTPDYLDTEGNPVEEYKKLLPLEGTGAFVEGKGKPGYHGNEAAEDFFEKITPISEYPQGVECKDYKEAFALLQNADEYRFNVISAPGMLGEGCQEVITEMVSMAEERGDCITVIDFEGINSGVLTVKDSAQLVNSSYAATYWPWLQVYSATGRLVWVPASTVIPGVYANNDKMAAPWFAPAGMNRGSLSGVIQTRKKLVKTDRDKLYKANINPIASFPGSGLVIYGQKTLQKKASALDRVNVRRLLIELKENVRRFAGKVLFEHNTSAIRNSFRAELETYLSSVVTRRGLYDYNIILDELNDPETIDRNEFKCQIVLQPTKVIEFVYVDFVITNTGVEFNS